MNDQANSREQLIAELQKIRTAYDELKSSSKKDIADLKKSEADLIKDKEKVEKKDRFKSEFIACLSHELRTPLNVIVGASQILIESEISNEEQQEFLHMINKNATRLFSIINDLYYIAAIEAGRMDPVFSAFNVNEKMEYVYNFFKSDADQKGLRIFVEKSLIAEEAIIRSDDEKFLYVLKTLVNIAIKVTDSGSVKIGYKKTGNLLEFFVKDMGKGIGRELMGIIFEKFHHGDILITHDYELTGLGLALSKAYVEMLGGKIWVESEPGKGSTFYFTIPYNFEPEINT